ncbi:MAG TPA: heavy metal translocating P-type ATPase metal-binding domain-containing protein [Opitutaceae bacterium]|nr:heavy metal translocating P-type ATPase metal-binding domain-containing protein [Opitutaceae bacterium]
MSVLLHREAATPTPRKEATKAPPHPCRHCGAPLIDDRMRESGFCCAGCSYVYRLVHEHGLAGYYRIKDDVTAPADAAVFQPRDYAWLETAQREAEADGAAAPSPRASADGGPNATRTSRPLQNSAPIPELTLDVQGISCAGCVWLIERLFQPQPGARDIFVNAQYGTMRLRWVRGKFNAVDFARKLQAFGYLVGPTGESTAAGVEPEARALVKRIGLCAAFAMNVMLFTLPAYFGMAPSFEWAGLFRLLAFAFGTLSFLVGGTFFLGRAVRALRERALHIDLPIAIGIVGAYAGSLYGWLAGEERVVYFDFVATFILLMLVGRWAQVAAVERNRRRLLSQQPKFQRVRLATGADVPPEKLAVGDAFGLAAGQTLPVEATLRQGEASFSLASINGEAEPRLFRAGQRVPAGALNLSRGAVGFVATQTWRDSLLAQLLAAGERPVARHAFFENIVRGYVVGILVVATLSGVGWWFATSDPLRTWAIVTAVLVVSCPCAIALAFPLADEMATVALRRRGVFVREGDLWPRLARVRQVVFDKTGTLTLETPVLQNPEALRALDLESRRALLALVRDNPHPVSQALFEYLLADGDVAPLPGDVRETAGFGVELAGWSLGRAGWRSAFEQNSPSGDFPLGGADTVFAQDGRVLARFRFLDTARPDARAEIAALSARGLTTFILSGDRREKVVALAAELALPQAQALGELTPQEKAAWLDAHGADATLMLGDGANDSLAFDRALCRGTPVIHRGVLERKADFYYLGRGIGGLRALFAVDAIRRRTQRAILIFSVVYNLLAVGLAVAGRMNPLVAAALMPINSLLTLALVTGGMRRAFAWQP